MTKNYLRSALFAAFAMALAVPATAGDVQLTIQNGRVTLIAQDAPLRQILQEWARIGQTKIVNADKVFGPNLTLQLVNVAEKDALDTLLRSASGYVAAPRATMMANASMYDRVMIMPMSRAPAPVAAAPAGVQPPVFQRPPTPVDDDDEPVNVNVQPPPGVTSPVVGAFPGAQPPYPPGQAPQNVPVLTSPRPGALPTQQTPGMPPNPLQPSQPTVVRPVRPGGPGGAGGGGAGSGI